MESSTFDIKSYPDMWESLGMNVERFEKMRCVFGAESASGITIDECEDNELQTKIKV